MKAIHIQKYVNGLCEEELTIPVAPVRFLAGLMPDRARHELLRHGLDLDALLDDAAEGTPTQWLDIEEKQVAKRIRITRTS